MFDNFYRLVESNKQRDQEIALRRSKRNTLLLGVVALAGLAALGLTIQSTTEVRTEDQDCFSNWIAPHRGFPFCLRK